MANNQRLLEGEVMEDVEADPSEVARLRDELRRMAAERDAVRAENIRLRQRVNQVESPAAQLRQTLEPLYNALRAIMGEIEVIDPQPVSSASATTQTAPTDSRTSSVWESWKQRLGDTVAKGIAALQMHGELNTQQLAMVTGLHRKTITNTVVYQLNKAGLINKNGGRFSLKQL